MPSTRTRFAETGLRDQGGEKRTGRRGGLAERRARIEQLEQRTLLSLAPPGMDPLPDCAGPLYAGSEGGGTVQALSSSDFTMTGPSLLKDVNACSASASPTTFTALNGITYFFANDGIHGRELWRTDGTAGGTYYVKDINLGSAGIDANWTSNVMVAGGNTLYFSANDGSHGGELWLSDGTPDGTHLGVDLRTGSSGSAISSMVADVGSYSGSVYFVGQPGGGAVKLYISAGDASTTHEIYWPGSGTFFPEQLTAVGMGLVFSGWHSTYGREPMYFSGTFPAHVFGDYDPGGVGSSHGQFSDVNGKTFYEAQGSLYLSAGGSTPRIASPGPTAHLNTTEVSGWYLFNGWDAEHGSELWKFDGDPTHMTFVKDINPGTAGSVPDAVPKPVSLNGMLYFVADDGSHGAELWKSDGTSDGTTLITDLTPGSSGSVIESLTVVGSTVFFTYDDGAHGRELWKTDGTPEGTILVKDILPGSASSGLSGLFSYNGMLLFAADDGVHGAELWRSNGTPEGTTLVFDINTNTLSANASQYVDINGVIYFVADDGVHGPELWKTDRTEGGTQLVKDINPGAGGSAPHGLVNVNGTLYFAADDGTNGVELWQSDGSPEGTAILKNIAPGAASSSPESLINVGGKLFFVADDGASGKELWQSNGAPEGTALVKDIYAGSTASSPRSLVEMGGSLYFIANDGSTGDEVWRSNGTPEGTGVLKDVRPGGATSSPTGLTSLGESLYFGADNGTLGSELWKSNGTPEGTALFMDIRSGPVGSSPQKLVRVGSRIFFTADNGSTGQELWVSNGTPEGTYLVHDIVGGTTSSGPDALTAVGNEVYFTADPGGNREVWKSNGEPGNATQIMDINPSGHSNPGHLTAVAGTLFFTATDGSNGTELWMADGTWDGTQMVSDLLPGQAGSSPFALAALGSTLFFTADDGLHGAEPWMLKVNRRPTDVNVSSLSVDEGLPTDSLVGALTTSDLDPDDTFIYELVPGDGDHDNDLFSIEGDQLKTAAVLDHEGWPAHRIFIRTTDSGGLSYERLFIISVNDVNEPPSLLGVDTWPMNENQPIGTLAGVFFAVDDDEGDTATFSLPSDPAYPDNALFAVDGDQLKTAAPLDFEVTPTCNILVRATDKGGASLDKAVTIVVNNVNEAPTSAPRSYSALQNRDLVVNLPGVLQGAMDPEGNTVTAVLCPKSGPWHGTLSLDANGSFIYRPSRHYVGTDTFMVQAFDGVNYSAPATMTITVDYDPDPAVQAPTAGSGGNRLRLWLNGANVQLVNQVNGQLLINQPLSTLNSIVITGANNKSDTLTVDCSAVAPWNIAGVVLFHGGTGTAADTLVVRGGSANDTLLLGGASARINELGVQFDGTERVTLDGGAGNDTYGIIGLGMKATISDSKGIDLVDFTLAPAWVNIDLNKTIGQVQTVVPSNAWVLALRGTLENVIGTPQADVIRGNSAGNRIEGRGGNDTIYGGLGNDTLLGDDGNDKLYGGAGNDLLYGGLGDDWLCGDAGNDKLYGGPGSNVLLGGAGADLLDAALDVTEGLEGRNLLIGGTGADTVQGGLGEDILVGGATTYDTKAAALLSVMNEWRSGNSFGDRCNKLDAGFLDNGVFIQLRRKTGAFLKGTVLDDAASDVLLGGLGSDWFFDFPGKDIAQDRGGDDR